MFKQLYKEHLILQKAFCSLYYHLGDKNNNYKNAFGLLQEKKKMEAVIAYLQSKVIQLENDLRRENERCELLEFCFLELENQTKVSENVETTDCAVNTDLCWTQCCLLKSHTYNEGHTSSCCWLHVTSEDAPIILYCCHCSSVTLMSMDQQQYQRLEQSQKKLSEISRKLDLVTSTGVTDKEWCCVNEIVSAVGELQSIISWIAEKKGGKEENSIIADKLYQLSRIRKVLEKAVLGSQQHLHHFSNMNVPFTEATKTDINSVYSEHIVGKSLASLEKCKSSFIQLENNPIYSEQVFSLPHQLRNESFEGLVQETEDQHDSLGTAVSEDEGLGEESRRGDSVGSNSLSEINDQSSDVTEIILDAPSPFTDATSCACSDWDGLSWVNDSSQRNSVELCLAAIAKLKESLQAKEKEVAKLKSAKTNKNEVAELHLVVRNLQKNVDDLQSSICVLEKENSSLKEQVLELEEAENDARLQGQRLEEKLLFLQEKDSHFQVELAETKHALELCLEELSLKDVEERELQSQLKFMEVLVQKYEEQIGQLESSRNDSPLDMNSKNSPEASLQRSIHETTQRSTQKEAHACSAIRTASSATVTENASILPVGSCQEASGIAVSRSVSSSQCHLLQQNCITEFTTKESSTQTDAFLKATDNKSISCCVQTDSDLTCTGFENSSNTSSCTGDFEQSGITAPIQKELLTRLHHLVEEDAHLQQQLYQVDQINLNLWQKLHNLQFHIGECQRENMTDSGLGSLDGSSVTTPAHCFSANDTVTLRSKNNNKSMLNSGILDSLGYSEERLKDSLLRLEKINAAFLKKLQVREKLCVDREHKHAEWMKTEDQLTEIIKNLGEKKEAVRSQMSQIEAEKVHMSSEVEKMDTELTSVRQRHGKEFSSISGEQDELLHELQIKIDSLVLREKECLKQISKFKNEKKKAEDNEFQNLKSNYVQLQLELVSHRDEYEKVKKDFSEQLKSLNDKYSLKEKQIMQELESFKGKCSAYDQRLHELQLQYKELQGTLKEKEQELEIARVEFRNNMLSAEEEHKLVESELRKNLLQMEQETAFATKALTEERVRLEKELQENISDLRCKEELYKARIMELESNVSQLHCELHRLTGSLNTKFDLGEASGKTLNFQREQLLNELQELRTREGELREKLDDMEKKEAAYRETLEHADRIVASVERGYKNKIEELEMSERSLKQRVGYLEEVENRLRVALHKERRTLNGRTPDDLVTELAEAEKRENSLKEEISSLEQAQRSTIQRVKELEKVRERLELQLNDREELEASLKKLQQEHDHTRKELTKIKISESSLQVALHQTEGLLETRESEIKAEIQQFSKEKKDLEETISQLRAQVRDLKQRLEKHAVEEEPEGEMFCQNIPLSVDLQPDNCSEGSKYFQRSGCASYDAAGVHSSLSSESEVIEMVKPKEEAVVKPFFSCENKACFSHITKPESTTEQLNPTAVGSDLCVTDLEGHMSACSADQDKQNPVKREQQPFHVHGLGVIQRVLKSNHGSQSYKEIYKVASEYSLACHQLKENMSRAMTAVKLEMKQKEASFLHGNENKDYADAAHLSPTNFHVLQQVGDETILVGWEYPQKPAVEGFEIYVDNCLYETIYASDRRKSVISGLDLSKPVVLGIRAVLSTGVVSEMETLDITSFSKPEG